MVKRALMIGINYNNDKDARLYGCINDAMAMHNLLIDAYGYDKSNICVLRDDGVKGFMPPTKSNILEQLQKIVSLSKDNDEIWIHYSGHGSYIRDSNGDEYDRKDEILIPSDYKQGNIIVDDDLKKLLNSSKGLVYITLDCCHSGTGWDLPYLYRDRNNTLYRYTMGKEMENKNIYMLSGARDYQTAADSYSQEQVESLGAFTNAFIECARFHNHNVELVQLHSDVNKYLSTKGYNQISELTSSNTNPYEVKITRAGVVDEKKTLTTTLVQNNMRTSMRSMKFT